LSQSGAPSSMVEFVQAVRLAGFAAGALGGVLLFLEFFQLPNYVNYDPEFDDYSVDMSPAEVRQYTWAGRAGALLLAAGCALEFFAVLVG